MNSSQKKYSDSIYSSKKDLWLAIPLLLFSLVVPIILFSKPIDPLIKVFGSLFFIIMAVLYPWIIFGISYRLTHDYLIIRCMSRQVLIPLCDITEVYPTHNPLSAPACSLDRLRIKFQGSKFGALISPNDKDRFIGDLLLRCPQLIQDPDNYFHMVWTVSWKEKGIGYARSKDLINWSEQKYIPVMEHESNARNCWTPELFYDNEQDLYLIYWATTIPGRFPETDSMGDNGYNHRIYYTTTRDFEDFSDAEILYDRGFNVIDAVIVKTDSNYTMFLKDETRHPIQKNIRIATSKNLTGPYSEPSEKITQDWVEGPAAIKIGDQYHLYFDRYIQKRYGLIVSSDFINWKDLSNEFTYPSGMRHGTVFKVTEPILKKLMEI